MPEFSSAEFENIPSPERKESGRQVEIVLKFIRHGERTKEGALTDYGRSITAERAQQSGLQEKGFDAVKAVGSNAGPKNPRGMGRSLETADIYAHEIAGDEQFASRAQKVSFDGESRPAGDFYLDKAKLEELKDFYIKLHNDQKS